MEDESTSEAPPFDPASRQDLRNLCEQLVSCPTDNAVHLITACDGSFGDIAWSEVGYFLAVTFASAPASHTIHFAPRLWVGDPRDSFHVRAYRIGPDTPLFDQEMSVAEIERGFDTSVSIGGGIFITFQPVGVSLFSRTLQWAFPVGSITDGMGNALSTCLQVGYFTPIPQHGFLHLQEGTDGRLECAGTPLHTDPFNVPMTGWAREVSSPTLYFIDAPPAPTRHLYQFPNAREALGWGNTPFDLDRFCSTALVVADGTFAPFTGSMRVDIGVRPGTYVEWNDAMSIHHQGIAGHGFTILENANRPVGESYVCSPYGNLTDQLGGCELDTTNIMSRYTLTTPPPGTMINPYDLYLGADFAHYNQ